MMSDSNYNDLINDLTSKFGRGELNQNEFVQQMGRIVAERRVGPLMTQEEEEETEEVRTTDEIGMGDAGTTNSTDGSVFLNDINRVSGRTI